ncbi:MAG TPA: adenylate/guanylate cyclase domain-containing protein, partial [Mycobacteriales bacterium]|nr:adenylate/guanylate cyclase domain-containing protein [Mycobacteriales bacterium]
MSSAAAPDLSPYICRYGVLWLAEDPAARHRRIDGTVVFTDLSGFTALSERLTAAGRVGAEEMATRLDNVFTSLLAEARDRGGSLVHFGGDALALLFSGDGHEVRAVATAAAMNRALKPHKRMETPTGVVKLGMSTGVWSGDVDLFLLGKRSQQLLLAGPAATGVTALEGAASSGEVLVSARTAAALPASCTRPWSDNVAMLARAPRDRAWEPVDVPDGVDVTKLLPVALRRHLLVGGGEPEHRSVTIAFVRWTGLDALLQSEGPGRVGGRLDELVARAEELTLEWGITLLATDLSGDGGKLLVAAGVPVLHEDDETRALLCMRALAAENPGGLGLRIGLHSGHAFAAAVGAPFRRTFTCIGDTVNTAARVMSKAEPGQVLATDDVLARSRRLFAVDALPEFAAKGKALPLRAFVVGEEQGARAADAADEVIGREAEIATLVGAVDDSAVVTISAEPGVGKTSLLAAALAALGDDATVLTTSCAAHAIADPYSAARPLLRQLLGDRRVADVAPALAPWAPLIAIVTGLDEPMTEEVQRLDPSLVTDRLQQAVAQLLDAGLPARALLVVDDAQWADSASAALLQHLVGRSDRRYGLWLAARPEVEPRFGEPTLQLGPLSEDAALRLVRAHAAIPLLPVQARAIVARAAGNPLFLRELARAASALEDTADLPLSVESIVGSRIDRLSPADRDLLSIASVMGADIDDEIVDQIAPIAAEESTWERLADFVERAGDGHRFRHAVYQQVAYARLPFKQRRVLHGEIGGRIEKRDGDRAPADRLSLHFTEAQEWDAAWEWSLRAAEVASAAYARVDEMVALQRAIVAGDRAGKAASDRQGVMWQLAETASEGGQPHIAIATLQRLTKVVEPAVQARAYARLAVIHQEIGDAARSRR